TFKHSEAFSFQIATEDQEETDRYWNAIVGNGGTESACGWCKDKWGLSWQITPRVLTEAMAEGGDVAKRAFEAMLEMRKIEVARIEAAVRGAGGQQDYCRRVIRHLSPGQLQTRRPTRRKPVQFAPDQPRFRNGVREGDGTGQREARFVAPSQFP